MKAIKQISFIGLAIMFVLNSCTMEKRVYTSGYHVAWKNGKHNSNKHTENEKQIVRNQTVKVEQTFTASNNVGKTSAWILIEDNISVLGGTVSGFMAGAGARGSYVGSWKIFP